LFPDLIHNCDTLSDGKGNAVSLLRVAELVGKPIPFQECDVCDLEALDSVFAKGNFDGLIHLAALKAVGESVVMPYEYYSNNLIASLNLIKMCQKYNVKNFIFSSSATVYGVPKKLPITEDCPTGQGITNPYGQTKYMMEQILIDVGKAHPVAIGKLPVLKIFGDKWDTPDGTGVRDYIHIVDLARGHVKALDRIKKLGHIGTEIYNLGTGTGYSVKEMVAALEKASGRKIPTEIGEPRTGDVASVYCDPSLALKMLDWKAEFGLEEMSRDLWHWQSLNPNGFSQA
ncbi:UDP-glucose 4-epimerase, partial [Ancylostoma duodenale]